MTAVTTCASSLSSKVRTKETLGTPQIRTVVNRVVTDWLKAKFASSKRDDKQQTSLAHGEGQSAR